MKPFRSLCSSSITFPFLNLLTNRKVALIYSVTICEQLCKVRELPTIPLFCFHLWLAFIKSLLYSLWCILNVVVSRTIVILVTMNPISFIITHNSLLQSTDFCKNVVWWWFITEFMQRFRPIDNQHPVFAAHLRKAVFSLIDQFLTQTSGKTIIR